LVKAVYNFYVLTYIKTSFIRSFLNGIYDTIGGAAKVTSH